MTASLSRRGGAQTVLIMVLLMGVTAALTAVAVQSVHIHTDQRRHAREQLLNAMLDAGEEWFAQANSPSKTLLLRLDDQPPPRSCVVRIEPTDEASQQYRLTAMLRIDDRVVDHKTRQFSLPTPSQ